MKPLEKVILLALFVGIYMEEGINMGDIIKLIIVSIAITALGVWYFMAGLYGWKYPKIKFESADDYEKITYQLMKIIIGIVLIISGVGAVVGQFIP